MTNTKEHFKHGKTFMTRVTSDRGVFIEEVTCGICGTWVPYTSESWICDVPYCTKCAKEA